MRTWLVCAILLAACDSPRSAEPIAAKPIAPAAASAASTSAPPATSSAADLQTTTSSATTPMKLPAMIPAREAGATGAFDARVAAATRNLERQIIELRHRIHQNPELSNREVKTAELVATHL